MRVIEISVLSTCHGIAGKGSSETSESSFSLGNFIIISYVRQRGAGFTIPDPLGLVRCTYSTYTVVLCTVLFVTSECLIWISLHMRGPGKSWDFLVFFLLSSINDHTPSPFFFSPSTEFSNSLNLSSSATHTHQSWLEWYIPNLSPRKLARQAIN